MKQASSRRHGGHRFLVRLTHWTTAFAMVCMIASGWRIYDASPLFGFVFPQALTMGGWLGGALAIHFAAMWLLAISFVVYLADAILSRHLRRDLLPIRPRAVWADLSAALTLRLRHREGEYNAVQKLLYILAILGIAGAIGSGLMLWKPVQFATAVGAVGGYEVVRRLHFAAMTALALFIAIHIVMVALVPSRLLPMITGRAPRPEAVQ